MNNKILSIKRNSAIFLAILLVLGTIATIAPRAQAQPYYEDGYESEYTQYMQDYKSEYPIYQDNSDYKSKDSSSSVINKIKCNNINSNNNGVDVSLGVPNNDDAIAEAQAADNEGQATSANEWGYGNEYKQKDNGFKFVCVNNNDNDNNVVVVNGTTPEPPIPEPDLTCEECFAANSALQTAILDFLADFEGSLSFSTTATGVGEGFLIGSETNTIEQLCAQIENAAEELGVPLSDVMIDRVLSRMLNVPEEAPEPRIDALIECLLKAGLIVDRELPSAVSISSNGIDGTNIECTDDPICDTLLQTRLMNSYSLGSSTNINTDAPEFQGTSDSSALEKITKLKTQWLDLLP